jgi:hypothetical protein
LAKFAVLITFTFLLQVLAMLVGELLGWQGFLKVRGGMKKKDLSRLCFCVTHKSSKHEEGQDEV